MSLVVGIVLLIQIMFIMSIFLAVWLVRRDGY